MSILRGLKALALDVTKSLVIVGVVSGVLFGFTGVWPPMVVVESGSMEPHLQKGDIVVVKAVQPDGPETVQTYREGSSEHFGSPGDVVVYDIPNDGRTTPIIHRAMYWNSGGYVTKGDNNPASDQRIGIADRPIKPEWIKGRAYLRVPFLGHVRLLFGQLVQAAA